MLGAMRVLAAVAVAILAACSGGEPDFALTAPDETVTVVQGQIGEIRVEVERFGGLERSIVVTAGGLRAGITPGALSLGPGDTGGVLTVAVETSAVAGPVPDAYLVGVAGELEHTAPLSLVVAPRP